MISLRLMPLWLDGTTLPTEHISKSSETALESSTTTCMRNILQQRLSPYWIGRNRTQFGLLHATLVIDTVKQIP